MLFLLGGYDLEMQTIKELLEKNKAKYIDKKLSWGAKLSDYKDELNFYGTIYGVELQEDITPPKNYKSIDHHNENSHKPSSLEQVGKILNIELNRHQQLVSANDANHIKGMQKLCATKEEIQTIRELDRKAQGVTDEDEELAKDSIKKSNSNIIYSKTPHFSSICDRVYDKFENYIVYDENKIVFYNYEVKTILDFLDAQHIQKDDCYYGGGEFGFVGIAKDKLSKKEILKLIKEFDIKDTISYHTFMLPFTFKTSFDKKENWLYKKFEVEQTRDFNEYVYFYKHVQDAIFNEKDEKDEFISKYYEYKNQDGTYEIVTQDKTYSLKIDGISLRIFNTNIAILSFNLVNNTYDNPEDILAINDFGRRIYPQFLGDEFTKNTKNTILASSISLNLKDEEKISDDFSRFDIEKNLDKHKDNLLPNYIKNLIKDNFSDKTIRPIIDDRMFVISMYINDAIVNKLKNYSEKDAYTYENDDFWYKYIFVDGQDKTCQSKYMTKEFIKNSTYDRWVEYGTLFGISRYSFVALTGSWYGKNILLPHIQTMYFQIFSLLLAYRASIIKFSDDIQETTKEDETKITDKTKKLYKSYLNFLNKLYFKEVTAQDQGIELYNQAMKVMDIDKYIKDLDSEVNELHSYTDMIEEKKTNETINLLTYIGGALLPPSIVTGFLGMNTLSGLGGWVDKSNVGFYSLGAVVISALIVPCYLYFVKKRA